MVVARAGGGLCGAALRHRPPGARAGARDDIGPGAGRADRRRGPRPRPPARPAASRRNDSRASATSSSGPAGRLATAVVLSIPFAISGRWGLLGVGFNNDLGLHLAWAEWLRSGLGPAPEAGYPLGPHALAATTSPRCRASASARPSSARSSRSAILTALTALAALRDLGPARRVLAAVLVALSYLAASYFAQGAFKETAEALFVLAFALCPARRRRRVPAGAAVAAGSATPRPLARPGRRDLLLLQLRRARLAARVVAIWGLTIPSCAARWRRAAAADPAPPGDAGRRRACSPASRSSPWSAPSASARLQPGRRQQHLRAGLAGRGARVLAGPQLPARRRRRRPPAGLAARSPRRAVGRMTGGLRRRELRGPGGARRLRPPLLRLAARSAATTRGPRR